jgi:hypothetical protein
LWEHRLHVENLFYSRLTSFLTIQAILLAVVGALYSKSTPPIFVLIVICGLGLGMTFIWVFAQAKHKQSLDVLLARARECLPEYEVTTKLLAEKRGWSFLGISPIWLIEYMVPSMVVAVWVVFLVFLLR